MDQNQKNVFASYQFLMNIYDIRKLFDKWVEMELVLFRLLIKQSKINTSCGVLVFLPDRFLSIFNRLLFNIMDNR